MAHAVSMKKMGIKTERVVRLANYTAEKVRTLCASPDEMRARWADAGQRADIIHQLADRVKRQQAAFFNYFKPEAQEILSDLLEKYASDGELQFTLPGVLEVPPIFHHSNVDEIIGKFGGTDQLRTAVNQLQSLLYVA